MPRPAAIHRRGAARDPQSGGRRRAQADAHPQGRVRLRPRRSERPARRSSRAMPDTAGSGSRRQLRGVSRPYTLAERRWDSPITADLARAIGVGLAGSGEGAPLCGPRPTGPPRILSRRPRRAVADCAHRSSLPIAARRRRAVSTASTAATDRLALALAEPLGVTPAPEHRRRRPVAPGQESCASA